jgi:archaemetzincin
LLCACSSAAPAPDALPPREAPALAAPAPAIKAGVQAPAPEAPRVRRTIQLTIMGAFPETLIPDIEAALRKQLGVHVVPTRTVELPEEAYYTPRKRYRAEKLLAALERDQHEGISSLGMTEVDISTTKGKVKDWGVFGLGMIGGTTSVISTHRLRKDKPSEALYRFRVVSGTCSDSNIAWSRAA